MRRNKRQSLCGVRCTETGRGRTRRKIQSALKAKRVPKKTKKNELMQLNLFTCRWVCIYCRNLHHLADMYPMMNSCRGHIQSKFKELQIHPILIAWQVNSCLLPLALIFTYYDDDDGLSLVLFQHKSHFVLSRSCKIRDGIRNIKPWTHCKAKDLSFLPQTNFMIRDESWFIEESRDVQDESSKQCAIRSMLNDDASHSRLSVIPYTYRNIKTNCI